MCKFLISKVKTVIISELGATIPHFIDKKTEVYGGARIPPQFLQRLVPGATASATYAVNASLSRGALSSGEVGGTKGTSTG